MDGVLVFERGGGKDPGEYIRTSVIALRHIVEQLDKNVDPKDLPLEFFGISPQSVHGIERQMRTIKEHTLDPLKGMLHFPEEQFSFLSTEAIKKGKKPEEWLKEEYR